MNATFFLFTTLTRTRTRTLCMCIEPIYDIHGKSQFLFAMNGSTEPILPVYRINKCFQLENGTNEAQCLE